MPENSGGTCGSGLGHTISTTTLPFYVETSQGQYVMNEHGHMPIKLYLQRNGMLELVCELQVADPYVDNLCHRFHKGDQFRLEQLVGAMGIKP